MSSPIEDYSKFVESDIDSVIVKFKKLHGKEPNIHEFKSDFLRLMRNPASIYLRVNLSEAKTEDLKRRFSEILKEQKKLIKTIPSLIPTPNVRLDELKRYLKIYDHRVARKLTWKEISQIEASDLPGDDIQRAFKRDLQNAKKIIKNVENCVFPGKYKEPLPIR